MIQHLLLQRRPRVILETIKPVSIFICPCRVSKRKVNELMLQQSPSPAEGRATELFDITLGQFEEECIGLHVRVQPRVFFLPNLDWVALALTAEISPSKGDSISFEQMLAFNSNFRVCQGELDRQDTPTVGSLKLPFALSSGRRVCDIFEETALQTLGSYKPHESLKRTVALSMAEFESPLSDSDLYAFGSIAHHDEIIDPDWATGLVKERAYDRWKVIGIRFFVHSYSIVCCCARTGDPGNPDLPWHRRIFLKEYVPMGARMSLERAALLDLRLTLQNISTVSELRRQREQWVDSRRILGMRWTAEGTQRAQIEYLCRQASGMNSLSNEIDQRFEQTVALFEAEEGDVRNRLLMWLQTIFAGFACAGLTATLTKDLGLNYAAPLTVGIGTLAMATSWIVLNWRLRRLRQRKGRD